MSNTLAYLIWRQESVANNNHFYWYLLMPPGCMYYNLYLWLDYRNAVGNAGPVPNQCCTIIVNFNVTIYHCHFGYMLNIIIDAYVKMKFCMILLAADYVYICVIEIHLADFKCTHFMQMCLYLYSSFHS